MTPVFLKGFKFKEHIGQERFNRCTRMKNEDETDRNTKKQKTKRKNTNTKTYKDNGFTIIFVILYLVIVIFNNEVFYQSKT